MFDPTIYDNLKVVLEGAVYDLDAEGQLQVIGRSDLIDLATLSRLFQMRVRLPQGQCRAEVQLSGGLLDFAAELQRLRLADRKIGAHLQLTFWLPAECAKQHAAIDSYLQEVFGDAARTHEFMTRLHGALEEDAETLPPYRIVLSFPVKIDESHIDDVEPLLLHLVQVLEEMERGNSFC